MVEAFSDEATADAANLVGIKKGQRVVGDINLCCVDRERCEACAEGGPRGRNHCPNRTTLGIVNKDGALAQFLTLPIRNLHAVSDAISDDSAVFVEPLAAACRILEQGVVKPDDRVLVIGDGKLGLLICEVLGRHLLKGLLL